MTVSDVNAAALSGLGYALKARLRFYLRSEETVMTASIKMTVKGRYGKFAEAGGSEEAC